MNELERGVGNNNVISHSPHWHISYNSADATLYGCDTTALVLGQDECYFILKGDHRNEFKEIIKEESFVLVKCLEYVQAHKDLLHDYSDLTL